MEQTKLSPEQVLVMSKGDTEIAAFIHSLLHTIETQAAHITRLEARVHELERQLDQNSRNSSKPPSSDGYRKPVNLRTKGGKKGAPKGHPGTTLNFVANPDHIVVHRLTTCADCGHSLADATHKGFERRQEVDIPLPQSRTTEHRAETGCCAHCGRKQVAAFPPHIKASTQYGLGFAAWAAYFHAYHMLPISRMADLFEDLTTYRPSEATLLSFLQTSYEVLEPVETAIAKKLLRQEVVHADETGCRVDGKLNWVHVYSDHGYTYLCVHEKRGEEAFKAIGFLPAYEGTVVHDCMKSYFKALYAARHALCNAHLLRECLGIVKHDDHRWAARMAELLREGWKAALAAREEEKELEPEVIQVFKDRYDAILREGEQEWALEEASAPVSKKGKQKKSKAGNLGERFMLHKEAILSFLWRPEIPFDNNQAERDLRMVKVKQKVSGAFRTQAGAVTFARLRSVISTLIKQKLPILSSLADAFRGTLVIPGT